MLRTSFKISLLGSVDSAKDTHLRLSTDPNRDILNSVVVTPEKEFIASDGIRIHKADFSAEILPGVYRVTKSTKTILVLSLMGYYDIEKYPLKCTRSYLNQATLQNQEKTVGRFKLSSYTVPVSEHDATVVYTQIIRAMGRDWERHTFNYKYILEALSRMTSFELFQGDTPISFKGDGREAVVMPLRISA